MLLHLSLLLYLRGLKKAGHIATSLQGNMSQNQRQAALDGFRKGSFKILVATDIAARGIDVTGIELVINYDLPDNSSDYVHRIGRTGRAGMEGRAISFVAPDQKGKVREIERLIRSAIPVLQLPELPAQFTPATPQQQQVYKKNMEQEKQLF